jgi:hypothetical protein
MIDRFPRHQQIYAVYIRVGDSYAGLLSFPPLLSSGVAVSRAHMPHLPLSPSLILF